VVFNINLLKMINTYHDRKDSQVTVQLPCGFSHRRLGSMTCKTAVNMIRCCKYTLFMIMYTLLYSKQGDDNAVALTDE